MKLRSKSWLNEELLQKRQHVEANALVHVVRQLLVEDAQALADK
jgi:hypothetical protein